MRHPHCRQLHAYWADLRGARPAPDRDDVDPVAIRGLLASVFLLDVAALPLLRAEDATFRLSGTRLDALFGRGLRGDSFGRIWTARSAATAGAALRAAAKDRRPATAEARGGPPGREALDLELLLLPLAPGRPGPTPLLGCLAGFSAPSWMGLLAAAPLDILSLGPSADARGTAFGRGCATSAAQASGRRPPTPAGGRPHPTVLKFRAP